MRILLLALVCIILCGSNAIAFDKWTTSDYTLQGIYTVFHIIDWGQTAHNAKNGWANTTSVNKQGDITVKEHKESNALLGSEPSLKNVNLYFASTLILHTAISHILPKPYRNIWQVAGIGIEVRLVSGNYHIGARGLF